MKIISKIPTDKFLVKINKDELANLLGEPSGYRLENDKINSMIQLETEVPISTIYSKHSLIKSIQNQDNYEKARRKLTEMLNALTPIENLIAAIQTEQKGS